MPRYIITFAHAQTWQIGVHVTIDVSHLVAFLEIGIISKMKEKNSQNKNIRGDISNTRDSVHQDIQTPRRECKNTTRSEVFLTKFEGIKIT